METGHIKGTLRSNFSPVNQHNLPCSDLKKEAFGICLTDRTSSSNSLVILLEYQSSEPTFGHSNNPNPDIFNSLLSRTTFKPSQLLNHTFNLLHDQRIFNRLYNRYQGHPGPCLPHLRSPSSQCKNALKTSRNPSPNHRPQNEPKVNLDHHCLVGDPLHIINSF